MLDNIGAFVGPPSSLVVHPKDELTVENGTSVHYSVTVYDLVGNATGDGRQVINLWVGADAVNLLLILFFAII